MAAIFEREIATYEREKKRLLGEALGKFALIKGDDVIGIYESQNDAIDEGWRRFPGEATLTKRIVEVEIPVHIPRAT
jgi:hypothetical protein